MDDLESPEILAFDWDLGNYLKNWEKHGVSPEEIEQVFFNHPLIAPDLKHSEKERWFLALGETNEKRLMAVIFTVRKEMLRPISARDMSRKERKIYEERT